MRRGDKNIVMASIDSVMELLKEVVVEARKTGADDMWMLSYVLAELGYVFKKEETDVLLQSVQGDIRLP